MNEHEESASAEDVKSATIEENATETPAQSEDDSQQSAPEAGEGGDAEGQGEGGDASGEAKPKSADGDGEQRPSRARDRIQQLIREKQAAEQFAQRLLTDAQTQQQAVKPLGNPEDYQSDGEYIRAAAEHAAQEAQMKATARNIQRAREAAAEAAEAAWQESTADFRAKTPDFQEVAHNPNLKITPFMADAIRESDRAGEIAYYLGKNPNEAARIAGLPPVSQVTAIARLEGRIAPVPSKANTSTTKATPPPKTLQGKSGGSGKSLAEMNNEEYRKARANGKVN